MAFVVSIILLGCAEQKIRDESRADAQSGNYEHALQILGDGVRKYPDSIALRSALVQTRSAALEDRMTYAARLRSQGRLDEAELELKVAATIDVGNERVSALLRDLSIERRQQAARYDAEQAIGKKRPDLALRVAEEALKDNPKYLPLVDLQRRLVQEQRQAQLKASQVLLSETRSISLDFRDAALKTVLDVVSRNSGINFILDRDIKSDVRVTVFLKQARVEDALDLLTGTNQLSKKVIDQHTIVIYPNTAEKQREYQEQIVRVFYLASAEAKGAAAFLKAMLRIKDPFVDDKSNMIALRESQENIQLAERLVALYDAGEPEVMLEVEVLEVASTRLTELGIQFPNSFSLTPLAPDGTTDLTLGNIRGLNRDRIGFGLGGVNVHLRREVGDFTTLANPKIRTRSKQKAKVLIGDKIPVVTATTGQTGFVADSVNYLEVGLKLDVEPTVYSDDDVGINLSLEVSSLGTAVKTNSGTLAYQISTRNASTLLRLHDGETQLLAGLISRDDRISSSRVPGIGDLPVLGRLFSDQTNNSQRTELILAITPRVIRNVRRPNAGESELWVGTEALPQLRPVGGLRADRAVEESSAATSTAGAAGGVPPARAPVVASNTGEPTPAPYPPRFSLSGPSEAKVGEVLEVSVTVATTTPLRGVPCQFNFDHSKLKLVEILEGDFFRQNGTSTSFSSGSDGMNGSEGKLSATVLRNPGTAITGQGQVFVLRFKTLAAGTASIRLASAQPVTLTGPPPKMALPPAYSIRIK